jgi:hypothetical protein
MGVVSAVISIALLLVIMFPKKKKVKKLKVRKV